MVQDHWSNDAMVSMDRWGLDPDNKLEFVQATTNMGQRKKIKQTKVDETW